MCGHAYNWHVLFARCASAIFPGANELSRLKPVHSRHLRVHQDHVEVFRGGLGDAAASVRRQRYMTPKLAEHALRDELINFVVLNNQNPGMYWSDAACAYAVG